MGHYDATPPKGSRGVNGQVLPVFRRAEPASSSLFGSEWAGAHLRLSETEIVTVREAMQHSMSAVPRLITNDRQLGISLGVFEPATS